MVCLDLVEQLHCLDDAQSVAGTDFVSNFHERLRPWVWSAIEGAHHGRFDDVAFDLFFRRGKRWGSWRGTLRCHRCWRGNHWGRHTDVGGGGAHTDAADADFLL